jgi:acetoin utilization deacetylase AcuC-like enzyme
MIVRKSTSKYTILTIVNYGKFQDVGTTVDTTKDTTVDTTADTTTELQRVHKQEYIKNYKEVKKPPMQFHQYQQNDYDFDELERRLLGH